MSDQALDLKGRFASKELDERVQRAVDNFMAGYGCCQSVVAAFSDLYGLDETMAKRIAAGFSPLVLVGALVACA